MDGKLWDIQSFAAAPPVELPARARVKVVHPWVTATPAMHGEILSLAPGRLFVRVPRLTVVGSTVQVRSGQRFAVGSVRSSSALGSEYQIEVEIEDPAC